MTMLWEKLLRPVLFNLNAEMAHEIGIDSLASGFASPFYSRKPAPDILKTECFGLAFESPLGLAAGFDKNGRVVEALAALGFGFIEVGTVTLRSQKGNEKPRMFRLPKDKALINRLGFNNDGAESVANRLRPMRKPCVVGINIGKNKDVPNEEAIDNYLSTFRIVQPVADYVTVNVSSPNTAGLRELQKAESLDDLLRALQDENKALGAKPLLVKIAPDLAAAEIEEAVSICVNNEISGIIATNTTISRDGLVTPEVEKIGAGGLSGRPLTERSRAIVGEIYRFTKGSIPIIGVGGIFTAEDAFRSIKAGASLVQAYTGFVYGGPTFAQDINADLAKLLAEGGFSSIEDAVGVESRV